ncbi:Cell morphology protein [Pseudomonas syringae pv. maculicola]|uniref:Cell morphology protein n=1 Tax=Pseudomonas syringae pv. maculicola TaxID=59511 RepID=A0A3M2VJE2_PSEYM|nr:Cell morphology protein [Pseudomonas syringae pv. maculicola]
MQRSLKKRGIDLLVAVVPDKSRIAAAQLCGLYRPDVQQARVAQWTNSLKAAGTRPPERWHCTCAKPAFRPLRNGSFKPASPRLPSAPAIWCV